MNESRKKTIGEYQVYLNKKLGSGGFGDVFQGVDTKTNQLVAVKMMPRSNTSTTGNEEYRIASLRRQAQILSKINSDFVVGFRDIIASRRNYYIIQQKCDGDLKNYLQKLNSQKKYLTQKEAIQFMAQILNGYYALIVMSVIHRDIKPENFLIKNGKLKIADFGLSRRMNNDGLMQSTVGTTCYQSPQIMQGEAYTNKCDVFSIGCVFYELLYNRRVINSSADKSKIKKRIDAINDQNFQFPQQPVVSQKCKNLIWRCLRKKQQDRISWLDLYGHQLFANKVPSLQKLNLALDQILSTLRKQIQARGISVQQFLKKVGINKNKQITSQDYMKLLIKFIPIEKGINVQYMKYSFNYFDQDENGKISYEQFVQTLQKHNMSMTNLQQGDRITKIFKKKQHISKSIINKQKFYEQGPSTAQVQELQDTNQAHKKLISQILRKNIENLNQQFNIQDLTQDGLTLNVFKQFIQKHLGLNLNDKQCQLLFKKFDQNNDNKVSFQQFNQHVVQQLKLKQEESYTQPSSSKKSI